jgi:hypothetical protein
MIDPSVLAHYRALRADGYAPATAMRLACYTYRAPTPADVAMHRVLTRARLLSGIRDTWRLAYCIARLDHQGK